LDSYDCTSFRCACLRKLLMLIVCGTRIPSIWLTKLHMHLL
jgi:hypothetical protein